jgi:Protein of unknown function (DUF1592)/Protein of unknown function (DUF1588)/Protein of unknown function (DUF1585)/Protein of unknown function (DUF1587)/Protein of unknown function (DUF1595)/Planctomycete cytochrome C
MRLTLLVVIALHGFQLLASTAEDPAKLSFDTDIKPLLTTLCYDCHGEKKKKGDVDLQKFADKRAVQRGAVQWQDALRALTDHEMPPENAKRQPTEVERERLTAWITYTLDTLDPADFPRDPGQVVLHRLTREEYNNTIRDLLGVDSHPANSFPEDAGGGGGFDNNADTLFVPPVMVEKMLTALGDVLGLAKPEKLFTHKPEDDKPKSQRAAAKAILLDFTQKAFRRPVKDPEVERYAKVYDAAVKKTINHEDAVKLALKTVLVSPNFLYRIEAQKPDPKPYEIGQHEMAVRLSYFLWATMPDAELFKLADEGKLHDPAVIEAQVTRMLKDPKAKSLGETFVPQWLKTEELRRGRKAPDKKAYPAYNDRMRDSMCDEPEVFFNELVAKNRSLLDLIDSDYLYVNEDLASLYEISGVKGNELREVKRPDDKRGGVLTMAGVLTVTSHPHRTSPVLRGVWVLDQIFNVHPPPPPPNVPALDDKKDGDKKDLTLRQRLEKHRSDPTCASCHARIDPLGFALQNYDLMGAWRSRDEFGAPVDAKGSLINGESFTGVGELRKVLLARKAEFARGVTIRLVSFALGRGVEFYDRPTINELMVLLDKNGYKIQPLIVGIAKSFPFRFKRNQPVQEVSQ